MMVRLTTFQRTVLPRVLDLPQVSHSLFQVVFFIYDLVLLGLFSIALLRTERSESLVYTVHVDSVSPQIGAIFFCQFSYQKNIKMKTNVLISSDAFTDFLLSSLKRRSLMTIKA